MDDEGRLKVRCLCSSGQVFLDRNQNLQHFLLSGKSNGVKRRAIGVMYRKMQGQDWHFEFDK